MASLEECIWTAVAYMEGRGIAKGVEPSREMQIEVIRLVLAEHKEKERQAALKLAEETFEEHFPGGMAEFRRQEEIQARRFAAREELADAAEELCDELAKEGMHCERLQVAVANYREVEGQS